MAADTKLKHLFLNSQRGSTYIFRNGKTANFVGGKYLTDFESEITELNEEIAAGHPTISVDENQITVDATFMDPLIAIKRKAVEEYLAAQAEALNEEKVSTSGEGSNLKGIGNSKTVAEAMSGSSSGVAIVAGPKGK